MSLIISLVLNALAVYASSWIIPGVHLNDLYTALIVAVVLGLINTFIKPVLVLLTLPITLLTLGLFSLVINALMILLVDRLVLGFAVDGFLAALIFSLVLSIISTILNNLFN
ncbi:hypothetical protein A2690_01865 [Candidatus Roizmanbacteria bacterium RIFCSPHIGHO2_01_FULL_39_12b]|uniref:Phage holin family protein n=1 Tax=Candidatus Roizmanbacteria bacterium RIFCSPHIGHO2_01_FULL_39_12b TaxID=1802030 RepID=A0A1F7GBK6_9BACT|nr:MAG: hypothetical protein A2690_01865 [Candidatus Roizmanbacteria bacterium RIFCSPHIGHO2_01_FULL_39_12b]OGK46168.1 MAG: hypothetical protein A3B46_03110 [Candidatus Roizmanbacteria bacterium RIFCSPLOWO2_01_FULL_39_19]